MRRDYAQDPALWPAVRDLLVEGFPGIEESETLARSHGLRWEEMSTPFVHEEGGRVVSHVGVLRLPLVVAERRIVVAGIHAVATRADARGRGLAGALLKEAVLFAEQGHETQILTAGRPELYERAGFSVLTETRFFGRVPAGSPGTTPIRPFSWDDPRERARLEHLLASREPVSRRLAATSDRDVFLFDSARSHLHWVDAWEGVLWFSGTRDRVRVVDVIAPRMPSWAEIARALPAGTDRVELCFAPDVVGGTFEPGPQEPDELLMVRGPFPADGPLILSPASRC